MKRGSAVRAVLVRAASECAANHFKGSSRRALVEKRGCPRVFSVWQSSISEMDQSGTVWPFMGPHCRVGLYATSRKHQAMQEKKSSFFRFVFCRSFNGGSNSNNNNNNNNNSRDWVVSCVLDKGGGGGGDFKLFSSRTFKLPN